MIFHLTTNHRPFSIIANRLHEYGTQLTCDIALCSARAAQASQFVKPGPERARGAAQTAEGLTRFLLSRSMSLGSSQVWIVWIAVIVFCGSATSVPHRIRTPYDDAYRSPSRCRFKRPGIMMSIGPSSSDIPRGQEALKNPNKWGSTGGITDSAAGRHRTWPVAREGRGQHLISDPGAKYQSNMGCYAQSDRLDKMYNDIKTMCMLRLILDGHAGHRVRPRHANPPKSSKNGSCSAEACYESNETDGDWVVVGEVA